MFFRLLISCSIVVSSLEASFTIQREARDVHSASVFHSQTLSVIASQFRTVLSGRAGKVQKMSSSIVKSSEDEKLHLLENLLGIHFSVAGRQALKTYVQDQKYHKPLPWVRIQHGIRVYQAAISNFLFEGYELASVKEVHDFNHGSFDKRTRRQFFNLWLNTYHPSTKLPSEFKHKNFHLFLLSVLDLDDQEKSIRMLIRPLFEKTRDEFIERRPGLFRIGVRELPEYFERIPYLFAYWRLASQVDPKKADRLNFSRYITHENLYGNSGRVEPDAISAIWGDAIWARAFYRYVVRETGSAWSRVQLAKAAGVFLSQETAKALVRDFFHRRAFNRVELDFPARMLENAIAIAYSMNGIEGVDTLLAKLLSRNEKLEKKWPEYLQDLVQRWRRLDVKRPLADPYYAETLKVLEVLHHDVMRKGLHPTNDVLNITQAIRLIDALNTIVRNLPGRYEFRWRRRFAHALAAIAAFVGPDVMEAPLLAHFGEGAWVENFFEALSRYTLDPQWRQVKQKLNASA